MRILVTGGAGFIGSHLVKKLREIGHDVRVYDIKNKKRQNISLYKNLRAYIRPVDCVFHLAALTSVPESEKKWGLYKKTNIEGTYNVLSAMSEFHVKKIIFTSSSAVYAEKEEKCSEINKIKPKSNYGYTKVVGEKTIKLFKKKHGIDYTILRLFNVYGPNQERNGAVIPEFVSLLLKNQSPNIYGEQYARDFIYVSDVVNACIKSISSPIFSNKIINVCNGKAIYINYLYNKIKKIIGSDIKAKKEKDRPGDINISIGCPKKYNKLFKFKKTSLKKGLEETIEWYRRNLK